MELRFTFHARRKLEELAISEDEVAEVLTAPDWQDPNPVTAYTADRIVGARPLRVVYVPRGEYRLVVTVLVKMEEPHESQGR